DGTAYYGGSLQSFTDLANAHGYDLVGCTSMGLNAFFVRRDQLQNQFPSAGRGAAYHYAPPRYAIGFGHPLRPPVQA
ncbi:MAG: hypothetical protein ACRCZF_25060, partial [Gemmataceae bacterium]